MSEARASPTETHSFQAEVSRLLELMVHSVYTEKDVFLRELISNASDACDKLRFEAIAAPNLLGHDTRLAIRVDADKAAGRLHIADNGIGMSAEELRDNLGTIARSGTRAFLDRLGKDGEGSALIGQFGVGFYSAFMVADHIDVVSRRAGSGETWRWSSDGANGFTLTAIDGEESAAIPRGTRISLRMKEDCLNYLEHYEIERIVKTYSDHVMFPVEMVAEDGTARQLNAASAIWQRARGEVTAEEHTEAYRSLSGHRDAPALTLHYKAEGRQSYAALLYVPTERPFDLFDAERKGRAKLYVKRVFITDDADLVPGYLRFVRGVIDSEDVPLNISREMLQNNPQVGQIRRAVTTRIISELQALAEKEPEKLDRIWETFGQVIKEGIYEDFERREALLKLARFRTTKAESWRTLKQYVADMREGQTDIYYLVGDNLERLAGSPQLEAARARGIEVLLLADPVDAFWVTATPAFDKKTLTSLSQGDVDLSAVPRTDDRTDNAAASAASASGAVAAIKLALGDAVADVRASSRLVTSPACLVAERNGPDRTLERMLQRQGRGVGAKPVLEVNTAHPLVAGIAAASVAGHQTLVADLAHLLLDQARIVEGELPADTGRFAERMTRYLVAGLDAVPPSEESKP